MCKKGRGERGERGGDYRPDRGDIGPIVVRSGLCGVLCGFCVLVLCFYLKFMFYMMMSYYTMSE